MTRSIQKSAAVIALFGAFAVGAQGIDQGVAKYRSGDFSGAFGDLTPLAEQGDATAQTLVGLMYASGQGVQPDGGAAAMWMRRAADQEHVPAQVVLAQMYSQERA